MPFMKETARFNTAVTVISLAVVGFVIVAGGFMARACTRTAFAPCLLSAP